MRLLTKNSYSEDPGEIHKVVNIFLGSSVIFLQLAELHGVENLLNFCG